eukprot:8851859-Pyramimonas_sp.AAC.1
MKGWRQALLDLDELLASWTVDFIEQEHGQALVLADCLSSQWTESVAPRAWLKNVVYAPMAPDATSFLQ